MSERKIIPSGSGMGVVLCSTSQLVVCVTIEYVKTGSDRYSKHRSLVLSVLRSLWRAHTIDTSHTLRVQTEQNRRTPDGHANVLFVSLSSAIKEYLEQALGLSPASKVRKHNFVFKVIMYNPKDPDSSLISDTILVVTSKSIQQLSALLKRSPLKHNEFELFLKDRYDYGSRLLLAQS